MKFVNFIALLCIMQNLSVVAESSDERRERLDTTKKEQITLQNKAETEKIDDTDKKDKESKKEHEILDRVVTILKKGPKSQLQESLLEACSTKIDPTMQHDELMKLDEKTRTEIFYKARVQRLLQHHIHEDSITNMLKDATEREENKIQYPNYPQMSNDKYSVWVDLDDAVTRELRSIKYEQLIKIQRLQSKLEMERLQSDFQNQQLINKIKKIEIERDSYSMWHWFSSGVAMISSVALVVFAVSNPTSR